MTHLVGLKIKGILSYRRHPSVQKLLFIKLALFSKKKFSLKVSENVILDEIRL